MRHTLLVPILTVLLTGCLVAAERPCVDGDCPEGFACDDDGYGCKWACADEGDCANGFVCREDGWCEPLCRDYQCPGHLTCNPYGNECLSVCVYDRDCVQGYDCCRGIDFDRGTCDWMGACNLAR